MTIVKLKKDTIIGKWKIVSDKPFKKGGQAKLYDVIDQNGVNTYVLKLYNEQKAHPRRTEFTNRFENEVKALNLLKGVDKIIDIVDVKRKNDKNPYYYIVIEKAECNLKEYLEKEDLSDTVIFELFSLIIQGIKSIHQKGIIHRDLKPGNILIKNNDIRIIDFGICFFLDYQNQVQIDSRVTKELETVGSRGYIAPESIGGRVRDINFQFDIFSLGKILYFLLSKGKELTHIYFEADENRIGNLRKDLRYNVFNTFFKKTITVDKSIRYISIDQLEKGFETCKKLFFKYEQLGIKEYNKIPLINSHILEKLEELVQNAIPNLESYEFTNNTFGFVEEYSRVLKLGLPDKNLNSLPEDIGILEELETLNLQGNVIIDLPNSFLDLTNIKRINLSENQIRYLPQGFGKNQKKLIKLNLSGNHLRSIDSNYMFLENLKILKLNSNDLNRLYDVFQKLKNLEYLSLAYNSLSEIPRSIFSLKQLRRLDLSMNRLISIPIISNVQNLNFLNISSNRLENITKTIGKLVNLKTLNLNNNKLHELPEEVGNLTNLEVFTFDQNKISILPENFKNLNSIIYLSFKHNNFNEFPIVITNFKNLRHLDMQANKIKNIPNEIGELINLETILLFINRLERISHLISKLKKLRILHLGHNNLGNIPKAFNELKSLETLVLSRNGLGNNVNSLTNLYHLKELDLGGNSLGSVPEWICNLKSLEKISFIECSLSKIPESIGNLENLTELRLEHNKIESLPNSIEKLKNLKVLMLHRNRIQNLPQSIQKLVNLEYLYIGGNQIKGDEIFKETMQILKENGCLVNSTAT